MPTEPLPTIVLAIDGLRAAALGAYGQTAYETPAFDALAAESITYDWCYAPTPDPSEFYSRLRSDLPADAVLVTDEASVIGITAESFAEAHSIEFDAPDQLAESIEQTTLAVTWEAVAEQTVRWADQETNSLLWIHTKGLHGPWDGPPALYESLLDEDDPEIEPSVAPPDTVLEEPELSEAALAASCRYAGQVITLDACLAGWLDILEGLMEGRGYRLVIAGMRGFSLGEHGRVGGREDRLFSEHQQVPLIVVDSTGSERFTRRASPVSLQAALKSVLAGVGPSDAPIRLDSPTGDRALLTGDWMLRVSKRGVEAAADGHLEGVELYVKPDDRWEQNDIASLEEQTAAELLKTLLAT